MTLDLWPAAKATRAEKAKSKVYSTRYTQEISHQSINQAQPSLSSEIKGDWVFQGGMATDEGSTCCRVQRACCCCACLHTHLQALCTPFGHLVPTSPPCPKLLNLAQSHQAKSGSRPARPSTPLPAGPSSVLCHSLEPGSKARSVQHSLPSISFLIEHPHCAPTCPSFLQIICE